MKKREGKRRVEHGTYTVGWSEIPFFVKLQVLAGRDGEIMLTSMV